VSLTGNLEDLPLLDIIQIVSFSKKTGALSIRGEDGEAGIVFHEGLVICAFAADTAPLDPRFAALPTDQRDRVIRTRIEIALEQLIRLREGQFSFSLSDEAPAALGSRAVGLESLSAGINPQELLLDLARGMDEDRRNSAAAVEASFAVPEGPGAGPIPRVPAEPSSDTYPSLRLPPGAPAKAASARVAAAAESRPPDGSGDGLTVPVSIVSVPRTSAAPPAPSGPTPIRTLLLVDDEDDVRRVLAGWLRKGGYEVVEAEDPEVAVKTGSRLGKEGTRFVLVTDLGMPTSGGSSFQGGFEVVKRLWKANLRPPVLMMTENLSQSLQLRARQMGIDAFVFKPGLSKLNPPQFEADLQVFARRMMGEFLPKLARAAPVDQPKRKGGAAAPGASAASAAAEEELSREFSFLQRRLAELRQPGDANQIAVLVVKVAREFFERAILFLVKNDEARGLGGFGIAPKGETVNLLARGLTLPLGDASPLGEVVQRGRPYAGPLPSDRWSNHLMGRIGRFQAGKIALLPLVAHRETIAVLYGDNPETGRDLARLEALELFVHQAGIALENAFLQRKLQSIQEKG
jgi:CheY-like chemotaxis protein